MSDSFSRALMKEVAFQFRYGLPIWLLWLLTTWWPNNRITLRVRGVLYRPFFKKCGKNLQIASGTTFVNPHEIEIGNNVYIAYYTWLNGLGGLEIGDEVVFGPYVTISTATHCYKDGSFRFGGERVAKVKIGKGCWLAAHASVSMGVTIGEGCLVAANAAVTKDVPPGKVVGGVPAQVIGDCEESEPDLMSRSGFKTSA